MSSRNYLSWAGPNYEKRYQSCATRRYQTLPNATTVENHRAHLRKPMRCGPPFTALKDPPPRAAELFSDPKGIGPRTRTLTPPPKSSDSGL